MAQVRALDVVADSQILPIERPRGSALGRFARKKPLGAAGGILVLLLVGTAVLADVLSTHDPVRTSTNVRCWWGSRPRWSARSSAASSA